VIANPISGRGAARAGARELARALEGRGCAVELFFTRAAGDAARRARAAEGHVDRIVAVGGDGTLNEVLNGLRSPDQTPLTQLAFGTANLLARELGLPREPEALAEVAAGDTIRPLDLGTLHAIGSGSEGERRFLLLASCGFDARVTEAVQQTRHSTLGFAGYVCPMLRALRGYRPPRLEVRVDGALHPAELVLVTNVSQYGGLFQSVATARPDSGQLDVCLFPRARRRDLLRIALRGARHRLASLPGLAILPAREIVITGDRAPVQVDGDHWGSTPVCIRLSAQRVPVLVPAPTVVGRDTPARGTHPHRTG